MARRSKPWFRKARRAWFVTINGEQHNLGPEKAEAYDRFYQLMRQPQERKVSPHSLAAIADAFLDWVQKQRSPDTYEWYRCRLERFVQKYPDLRVTELKPFHVETWVDAYHLSVTSRRNYLRTVKRCLSWAVTQGYLDKNPVAQMDVPSAAQGNNAGNKDTDPISRDWEGWEGLGGGFRARCAGGKGCDADTIRAEGR